MKTIRTILHPTDFSSASHFAMELACMLAREQRARLLLLHVVPRLQAKEGVPPLADEYQFELQRYQEDMKDKLRSLSMADSTVQIEYLQKEGEVADRTSTHDAVKVAGTSMADSDHMPDPDFHIPRSFCHARVSRGVCVTDTEMKGRR